MWQSGKFVLLRAFNTSLQHYLIYYAPPLISNPYQAINIEEALLELQVISWDYWCAGSSLHQQDGVFRAPSNLTNRNLESSKTP